MNIEIKKSVKPVNYFDAINLLEARLKDIYDGVKSGTISAIKFYPQGVTTNSYGGVKDLSNLISGDIIFIK